MEEGGGGTPEPETEPLLMVCPALIRRVPRLCPSDCCSPLRSNPRPRPGALQACPDACAAAAPPQGSRRQMRTVCLITTRHLEEKADAIIREDSCRKVIWDCRSSGTPSMC